MLHPLSLVFYFCSSLSLSHSLSGVINLPVVVILMSKVTLMNPAASGVRR